MAGPGLERRYELVERIAVGGMAEVFRAKAYGPHGFEKVLAIKRILPALASDPVFERRFIAEAKLVARLSHANIVQVVDFSRFGQSLYIVMEFIDGCDLAELLSRARERGVGLPLPAAMHVALEMLKGLDFAHGHGVVHRDVSPSNVLLSMSGEVKIADFGIALVGGFDVTRTRRVMGKWRYMSPEQARGEELDARSDTFAAGAVLFELFTGHKLFPGQDAEEIVANVASMEVPSVCALRPELPSELDQPLRAALERDPARRATVGEVLNALVDVCYGRSIPALPVTLARFLEDVPRRGRGGSSADGNSDGSGVSAGGPSGSGELLDEIVMSELGGGAAEAGAAVPAGAGEVRRTAMALGPPALHPDDIGEGAGEADAARASAAGTGAAGGLGGIGAAGGDYTGATHIRIVTDPDGSRRWSLEGKAWSSGPSTAALRALEDAPTTVAARAAPEPDGAGARAGASDSADARPTVIIADPSAGAASLAGSSPASALVAEAVERRAGIAPRVTQPSAPVTDLRGRLGPLVRAHWRRGAAIGGPIVLVLVIIALAGRGSGGQAASRSAAAGSSGGASPQTAPHATAVLADAGPPDATAAAGDAAPRDLALTDASAPDDARAADAAPERRAHADRHGHPSAAHSHATHPRYGTVDIYSEPWANIYLGGHKVGVAPQRGIRLPVGRHRLRLVNPVQHRHTTITVTVPSASPIHVTLPDRR